MSLVKDVVLWISWNPLKLLVQRAPLSLIYPMGGLLGRIAYRLMASRRRALEEEAGSICGVTNRFTMKAIVQKSFLNDAFKELEVLLFPVMNEKTIAAFTQCEGLEHLDGALTRGKGAMLLFAHFGANQMVMPAIGYRGYKMCQLSAPAIVWKDILSERELSTMEKQALQTRTDHEMSLPVKHINVFRSIKEAFLCLRRNEVLGLAIDGGGGKERLAVDFLGGKILLSPGPSDIARRTGCAVLPTFVVREKSGRNRIIIEPCLRMPREGETVDVTTWITWAFTGRLEEYVKMYPDHYISFMALRASMFRMGDIPLFR